MEPGVMTPYPAGAGAGRFLHGATLTLRPGDLSPTGTAALASRLRTMRDHHRIDTVSVYGMETWDAGGGSQEKDTFFDLLAGLGMRVVVRLEGYDGERFAFSPDDVNRLRADYGPLIRYVAAPHRRDLVGYLGINMPLDDPGVQRRLGGIDSPLLAARQPAYATAAVAAVRRLLAGERAGDVEVYLGVFYGWDNGYRPPPYRSAGADGYVLTSYSYPAGPIAGPGAPDAELINERRLRDTMRRFVGQYGPTAPVVVEYGFQTAAHHGGRQPDQTAGLVADRAAKWRALGATTRFYCTTYPAVRGTMYFGFNVYSTEGNPPAVLDFALDGGP
jgi:hypothetical protein